MKSSWWLVSRNTVLVTPQTFSAAVWCCLHGAGGCSATRKGHWAWSEDLSSKYCFCLCSECLSLWPQISSLGLILLCYKMGKTVAVVKHRRDHACTIFLWAMGQNACVGVGWPSWTTALALSPNTMETVQCLMAPFGVPYAGCHTMPRDVCVPVVPDEICTGNDASACGSAWSPLFLYIT